MPPIAEERQTREMRRTELQGLLRNPHAVDLEVEVEIAGPEGSSDGIPAAVTDNLTIPTEPAPPRVVAGAAQVPDYVALSAPDYSPPRPAPAAAAVARPRITMRALTARYPRAPDVPPPLAVRIAAAAVAILIAWLLATLS